MTTRQIIQVGFTVVGGVFGGPWGAFAGSLFGGLIGPKLDPQDFNSEASGPRLADNKVQVSTYGAPIPRVYGRIPIAGNVIWSSDIIEHAMTSSSTYDVGKGGGDSQTVTQTTYSYSVHLAIGLCAGPIAGIGKIWANGKLIFNAKAGTDANTVLASRALADGIRIYLGSETQDPDPLIESFEGAGNVPGYRGLAYVVLDDFQLAEFGNRIPLFEFEVLERATSQLPGVMSTIPTTTGADTLSYDNGVYSVGFLSSGTNWTFEKKIYDIDGNLLADQTTVRSILLGSALEPKGNWHGIALESYGTPSAIFHNVETSETSEAGWMGPIQTAPLMLYKASEYGYLLYRASADNQVKLAKIPIKITYPNSGGFESGLAEPALRNVPNNYAEQILDLWISAGGNDKLFFDGTWVWIADATNGVLYRYTQDLVLSKQWSYTAPSPHGFIYVFDDRFAISPGSGNIGARLFQLNDDGTTTQLVNTSWDSGATEVPYPSTPGSLIGLTKIVSVYPLLVDAHATLSDIVQAECLLGGLAAGDLDVTALTDSVKGYVVRRAPLRSNLEPLMSAFFFDAVESDGKLKFVKRGGASAVTLASTDLAAHAANDEVPDPVAHRHALELGLPNEVAVIFFNDDAAYEQGEQYARRLASNAKGQVTLELALVLTEAEAAHIAATALFDAWAARESFMFQTSRKYAKYEPGDVVTLPFPTGDTTTARLNKRDDGANGVIRWEANFTDASVYTQGATTQAAETPAETLSLPGPTVLEAMDIPLLRDVDDSYGFYAAALGYLPAWRGCQIYVSRNGGASYADVDNGLILTESTMGFAETALGTLTLTEQFDEGNTVDVRLYEGTLSNVTRDEVLNGANAALLGDEIFQFRTATQLAAQRYRLSGLLRGRLGTDWAVGGHAINERFVLLDRAAMRFLREGSADVNVEHMLKGVSLGNRLAGATEQLFTYAGVNLKPLSVVHLGGGRDSAGNLTIQWKRRTRLNATWRDYVDAPLGEETESYELDVMNGATVVRTITASTNTASYTAAQQTTDFGSPQASIAIRAYQVSTRVGRGYVATATV